MNYSYNNDEEDSNLKDKNKKNEEDESNEEDKEY